MMIILLQRVSKNNIRFKKEKRDIALYREYRVHCDVVFSCAVFYYVILYSRAISARTCVVCTHARVRGLLCRLEGRKYGVQLGMNYDRDFSSSGSLRESHRSAKLVGVSIAQLFAKEA